MSTPYPPSWLDRLTRWIERLPGSPWVFYVVLGGAGYLAASALRWLDGRQPIGAFDPMPPPFLLWVVGILALHHYLDDYARQALARFRPLLQVDQAEYERLEYELTVVPARYALIGALFWTGLAILIVALYYPVVRPYISTWEIAVSVLSFLVGGTFLQHLRYQLNTVRSIYRQISQVDLYNLEPLFAFSNLTVRAAIGVTLLQYAIIVLLPGESRPALFLPVATLTVVAVAVFIWPLAGVHRMLVEEKSRQMAEVDLRLKAAVTALYGRVDGGELDQVDVVGRTITSLKVARDLIDSRPTWPWQPAAVRSLATAILLPIVLWLLQQLLRQLLRL